MINVFYNTINTITFYLKPSLSNPVYLFSMVNYTTRERFNFISAELSNGSDLLQFSVTEVGSGSANVLIGDIKIKNFGRYTIEVYEQVSATNLDHELATFLGNDELISHKRVIYDNPPVRNDISIPVIACSISVTVTAQNESAPGAGDGSVSALVTGDQGTLTFAWTGPGGFTSSLQNITGLDDGLYTLIVTDDIILSPACSATDSDTVGTDTDCSLAVVNISTIDETFRGSKDGSATANISGGVGNITYLWDDADAQTTATATNLAAGTYLCTVTDDIEFGCVDSDSGIVANTVSVNPKRVLAGDDSSSINGGGASINDPVDVWADSSGEGNDATQSIPSAKPLWKGTYLQGDGTDWMDLGNAISKPANRSIYLVFKADATAARQFIMGELNSGGGSSSAGFILEMSSSSGQYRGFQWDNNLADLRVYRTTNATTTNITMYSDRFMSNSGSPVPTIQLDGIDVTEIDESGTGTGNSGLTDNTAIFRAGDFTSNKFTGRIYDLVQFESELSDADNTTMIDFFTNKHGL